jgi:hypothetical protein
MADGGKPWRGLLPLGTCLEQQQLDIYGDGLLFRALDA